MRSMRMAVMLAVLLTGPACILAQEQTTPGGTPVIEIPPPPPLELPLVPPEDVPETANFISAGHDWPPSPFNPFDGLTNIPVYVIHPAAGAKTKLPFLLFDDRAVVAMEVLEEAAAANSAQKNAGLLGLKGGSLESAPQYAKRDLAPVSDDLQIDIEDVTNGVVSLVVLNPISMTNDPVWDVFATTNLSVEGTGLSATNWLWLARTEPGQTNLLVSMLSETECYFRLASTNDTDGDGLTDAFEQLVSNSNPATNDTDGDGLLDGWSYVHFGHATGQASDHTRATDDSDNDGLTNLQEYQLGTSLTLADTDGDGLTDAEELTIPVDVDLPNLGYLDPLRRQTGNTGTDDGRKDSDHDGLSNIAELRHYHSNPGNAHSMKAGLTDAEYFHIAQMELSGAPPLPLRAIATAFTLNGTFLRSQNRMWRIMRFAGPIRLAEPTP